MNKLPFRLIRNEAKKSAQIFLYGTIGDSWYYDSPITAKNFQRQLSAVNDVDRIDVHLNGPGGDVHEVLAMISISQASKKDIHFYNDGVCLSAMAVLLASGKDGNRHSAKGTLTMFHSASTGCWGNASEMRESADMLEKHDDVLAEYIAEGLSITSEEVKITYLDGKDHWLTAKEAEALGLVTIEDYEAQDIPDNVRTAPMDQIAAFYNPKSKSQNTDMSILNFNNFKKISALGKVPVAERTADHLKDANAELEAEGVTGVTLVSDKDLEETITEAAKVPDLEKKAEDLEKEKVSNLAKITELQKVVDQQKKELGKPAEELTVPITDALDSTGKKPVVNSYETSFDREFNARFK